MLFSKPISDLTFEDVEEFCKRFHEDTRYRGRIASSTLPGVSIDRKDSS